MIAKMNVVFVLGFVLVASAFAKDPSASACDNEAEKCTPQYSSFMYSEAVPNDLQKFTSQLVDKSFHFLMLSSVFNQYSHDRPGFEKLYRKISDKAWEDAIDMIKYQSRRGGFGHLVTPSQNENYANALNSEELSSLKFALKYEKTMAKEAHAIHRKVSHAHANKDDFKHYDPDTAHYLDEKIIEYQSGVVRDLAGYIQNLKDFTGNNKNAADLGTHLFDEYLAKGL